MDSCLQFLDETAGRWPTVLALSLLGLALECAASRHRSRPSMENVSITHSFLTFKNSTLYVTKHVIIRQFLVAAGIIEVTGDDLKAVTLNCPQVLPTLSQLLPPPVCPLTDQPRSLDDRVPLNDNHMPSSSIPVEDDEQHSLPGTSAQAGPCECSQSEVTYLSDITSADGEAVVDLYCSWPVQCSCPAETGGLACEDCRANGFTLNHTDSPQSKFC